MPLSRVCCLSFFMALSQFSTEWGRRFACVIISRKAQCGFEDGSLVYNYEIKIPMQNTKSSISGGLLSKFFFFRWKKIKFFAHCVMSDIIVQDMPNCFKRAKEEQIDLDLIFYTDWFSCKKTWIWLLMFYARLVSQQ